MPRHLHQIYFNGNVINIFNESNYRNTQLNINNKQLRNLNELLLFLWDVLFSKIEWAISEGIPNQSVNHPTVTLTIYELFRG